MVTVGGQLIHQGAQGLQRFRLAFGNDKEITTEGFVDGRVGPRKVGAAVAVEQGGFVQESVDRGIGGSLLVRLPFLALPLQDRFKLGLVAKGGMGDPTDVDDDAQQQSGQRPGGCFREPDYQLRRAPR